MHMVEEFRKDAMEALGLVGHDKADWMWDMAWKNGHMGGFEEVFFQLQDLAKMFKKDKNETDGKLS